MPTIKSENQMIALGKSLAKTLTPPVTIELIGDVGAGKTTLTKGIAAGLGIKDPITSPSFTLSKQYLSTYRVRPCILVHYDFYRLPDPGIMAEDLAESIADPQTITIIEWADTVQGILPKNHIKITIKYNNDSSRTVEISKQFC